MDNSSDAVRPYKTGSMLVLKSFAVLHVLAAKFNNCIIKTILSDAKSCEEQDGGKYSFLGRTTAELLAILQVRICNEKHGKEAKTKDFSLAEEDSFPCKLC